MGQEQLQNLCNEIKISRRLRNDAAMQGNFQAREMYEEQLEDKYTELHIFMAEYGLATSDVKPFLQ